MENIERTSLLSATVVTPELLPFAEQHNRSTYQKVADDKLHIDFENGRVLDVPLITGAKFSYECEVIKTVEIGDSHTFFAQLRHINASEAVQQLEFFDLRAINPVIYSPYHYFTVGEHLGAIGDFSKASDR